MYKLYVGGLPFSTTDEELEAAFAAHGTVASAKVIFDRDTGRSKGFGFVEYENDDEGKAAETGMNETDLGGRTIRVSQARPMERNKDGNGFPRRNFDGNRGPVQKREW